MSPLTDAARADAERPAPRAATHSRVLLIALPVVLSNATVPIQGAIDTGIVGSFGEAAALAAVGLGAEIFALLLSSLNFLQTGVSGFSAQAAGRGDAGGAALVLLRGFMVGLGLALLIVALQSPLLGLGLSLFEASDEAESLAATYFLIRVWGAPAELGVYALFGWFTGQEMTRRLFQMQLLLTTLNVIFNFTFAIGLEMGVAGVALGTVCASYLGLLYGLWLARARVAATLGRAWRPKRAALLDAAEFARVFTLNRDIFIRTLLLTGAFAWMTRLGSLQGDDLLAANVVLFQFFIVSAYALDGFAMAAETLVGQSLGARRRDHFETAVRLTSFWAVVLAALVSLLFWMVSGALIDALTVSETTRALARDYAIWAAFIPLIGVASFQLDGMFIGATASRPMRDAMILSTGAYLPLSYVMMELYGNHGVWAALWIWLALRAVTLGAFFPALRRRVGA